MGDSLRFHTAIFKLLSLPVPVPSNARRDQLAEVEARIGSRLPASVYEWFSLESIEDIFNTQTNQDLLVQLDDLGRDARLRHGFLHVATECQASMRWFCHLGDGDDPPVFHDDGALDEDLESDAWVQVSDTFSAWVFNMLAALHFWGWNDGHVLAADDRAPNAAELELLRSELSEGPCETTPEGMTLRFFDADGLLHISTSNDGSAHWLVEAGSVEGLARWALRLAPLATLARTLDVEPELDASVRDVALPVIARLRAGNRG